MAKLTVSRELDVKEIATLLEPRDDIIVLEKTDGEGRYTVDEGPFTHYVRTVAVVPLGNGRATLTENLDYRLAIPYWSWLFAVPFRSALRTRLSPGRIPWWAPPNRIDERTAKVIGLVCALAIVEGFYTSLLTQTLTFTASDFGHDSAGVESRIFLVARIGIPIALGVLWLADRKGRHRLLAFAALGSCSMSLLTAFAPSLGAVAGLQTVSRSLAIAVSILIIIVAAEELPAGSRAYATGVLAMAGGLGAGVVLIALPLADLGPGGWRYIYLVPVVTLPLIIDVIRRLPETRRFAAQHEAEQEGLRDHIIVKRLVAYAGALFVLNFFFAPSAQLQNNYLNDQRGFDGLDISAFAIITGAPAGIGIVVGGKLADLRGRKVVTAVGLTGGVLFRILHFATAGIWLWIFALLSGLVFAAAVPALGVFGPELFPTGRRAASNGAATAISVAGAVAGFLVAGPIIDGIGFAWAFTVLGIGPLLAAGLVLWQFPETANRELEEINPDDPS
ncbi:MAG: hypothetical protein JJLCMIEE_01970 [Acidimicrobiales bacterium]|nr:hypothetical protein [Acidimicrobiales bacterium]